MPSWGWIVLVLCMLVGWDRRGLATGHYAVDWTYNPAWARHRRVGAPATDPDGGGINIKGDGYHPKWWLFGYRICGFVRTRTPNGDRVPYVCERFDITAAAERAQDPTVEMIRRFNDPHGTGTLDPNRPVKELVADRGYSRASADEWADPLRQLGVDLSERCENTRRSARIYSGGFSPPSRSMSPASTDGRGLQPAADPTPADWWLEQLNGWGPEGVPVSALVPSRFEAVAQVLHPWRGPAGSTRWSDIQDRVAPSGASRLDQTPDGSTVAVGELDTVTAETLIAVLLEATSTPDDVFVAVWEGWGDLTADLTRAIRIDTQHRGHLLWRGALEDVLEPGIFDRERVAAGLWWPQDRAWFVATEINLAWTFVAGSHRLIDRLVTDPRLEAIRTGFDAPANRILGET